MSSLLTSVIAASSMIPLIVAAMTPSPEATPPTDVQRWSRRTALLAYAMIGMFMGASAHAEFPRATNHLMAALLVALGLVSLWETYTPFGVPTHFRTNAQLVGNLGSSADALASGSLLGILGLSTAAIALVVLCTWMGVYLSLQLIGSKSRCGEQALRTFGASAMIAAGALLGIGSLATE